MPDGTAVMELRHRWADGTTDLVFDPVWWLERLAALTPRPWVNVILYHGDLAPRASWRRFVVPSLAPDPEGATVPPASAAPDGDAADAPTRRRAVALIARGRS